MKKSIRYLLSVILVVSTLSLIGCGGGGKAAKKNPYEGKMDCGCSRSAWNADAN